MFVGSAGGFGYFALLFDDAFRYSNIVLLKRNSDLHKSFVDLIENGDITISKTRVDQGLNICANSYKICE